MRTRDQVVRLGLVCAIAVLAVVMAKSQDMGPPFHLEQDVDGVYQFVYQPTSRSYFNPQTDIPAREQAIHEVLLDVWEQALNEGEYYRSPPGLTVKDTLVSVKSSLQPNLIDISTALWSFSNISQPDPIKERPEISPLRSRGSNRGALLSRGFVFKDFDTLIALISDENESDFYVGMYCWEALKQVQQELSAGETISDADAEIYIYCQRDCSRQRELEWVTRAFKSIEARSARVLFSYLQERYINGVGGGSWAGTVTPAMINSSKRELMRAKKRRQQEAGSEK